MRLRGRIRRLKQKAASDSVILKLTDGSTHIFDAMEAYKDMFLTHMGLYKGEAHPSEILDAVRAATPESRAAFEAQYGPIEMVVHIVAAENEGGWVEEQRLLLDGTVDTARFEGGSEEVLRIRQDAQQRGAVW